MKLPSAKRLPMPLAKKAPLTATHDIDVGELRLIPKGRQFWSIKNQTSLTSNEDEIVEIKHTCYGSDQVFVTPKQLLFNIPGQIPTLIGKGVDEWGISYSKTLPYTVPEPQLYTFTYTDKK